MSFPETIKIEHAGFPDGYIINASDFDPETMVRFEAAPKADGKVVEHTEPTGLQGGGAKEPADDGVKIPAKSVLEKSTKSELVAIAQELGLKVVPDEMTNKQIIELIETKRV